MCNVIDELISNLKEDKLILSIYFTSKLKNGNYASFSPSIDEKIYDELLVFIINYVQRFANKEIVNYNPTGFKDETIETCNISYIRNYNDVIESFENSDTVETEIDPDDFNFYTLEIKKLDQKFPKIQLFRRVTKFKKLHSKGIIAKISGNKLNKVSSKLIGIDGEVDFIVIDEKVFVLSHYSLERIFNLDDQFKDTAAEFLNQEGLSEGISNFDNFYEDCLNDGRYRKTLSKMSSENIEISSTYENYENIKRTIDMFELEINYSEEPHFTIIYEEKDQIMNILRILRDSYYLSIINEKKGVDDK